MVVQFTNVLIHPSLPVNYSGKALCKFHHVMSTLHRSTAFPSRGMDELLHFRVFPHLLTTAEGC